MLEKVGGAGLRAGTQEARITEARAYGDNCWEVHRFGREGRGSSLLIVSFFSLRVR